MVVQWVVGAAYEMVVHWDYVEVVMMGVFVVASKDQYSDLLTDKKMEWRKGTYLGPK
jgi:hypothetical protein